MPTYDTLPEGSSLVQNKTQAFLLIPVSANIDVGLFWQKASGNPNAKLKATVQKPDGALVEKLAENGEILVDNTSPQRVKVLFLTADLAQVGTIKILTEFKFDDGWLQAEIVSVPVVEDLVAG